MNFVQRLKQEANYHPFLRSFFIYRTFELVLEKKKSLLNLPHMIKELLRSYYHYESYLFKEKGSATEDEIEIFPGIIFTKGITYKILESLNLEKTKFSFLYHLMILERYKRRKLSLSKTN